MKAFLYRTILFLLFFATFIFFVEIVTAIIIQKNASFKIDSEPKYIIFGPSISSFAYNDSLIDSFVNLSLKGEPYFYTYPKVKEVIKQNGSLTAVFIEFSNGSIDEQKMTEKIWNDQNMHFRYPRLSSFISVKDHLFLMQKNFSTYLKLTGINSYRKILTIIEQDYEFAYKIGGYSHLDRNKTDSLVTETIKNGEIETLELGSDYDISNYNLLYLDKIIKHCKESDVHVILIRSPLHELYPLRKNELIFQELLLKRFNDVEFLDLVNFNLDNFEFADLEHLNYKGARRYSIWFDNLLKSGLLDGKINQDEINRKIELENTQNSLSP